MSAEHIALMNRLLADDSASKMACAALERDYRITYQLIRKTVMYAAIPQTHHDRLTSVNITTIESAAGFDGKQGLQQRSSECRA